MESNEQSEHLDVVSNSDTDVGVISIFTHHPIPDKRFDVKRIERSSKFQRKRLLTTAIWKCCSSGSKLLCMRKAVLAPAARWHILLCAVFCLLAIPPFGYAQSITELKSKAEDGDVQAQLVLAKAYHLGEGVSKDDEQAVHWWEKAAEHGDASAQINLAGAYQVGAGVPKNYAAALRWYTKAAEQGNADGQAALAGLYHLGQGVPKDDAEAVRWWKKAAEQGNVEAEGNLGTAYGLGVGVPKDEVESVRWHTEAADNGNAASQFSLGMFYMSGSGVPKNEAESVKWLRKSAEQGNADGEFWLGAAYYAGTGVAKDTAEALRWYRKAGDHGNAAAQYNLGQAYNLGNGVERDTAEAARWWQKAAEQGLAKAQYNLGLAYHDGVGVQKDNVQAYFWIAIAATSLEQGFVKDHRDKAEAMLTAAQLADVQERIRKWLEPHPATQTASLNSLPSVPQNQQQTQTQEYPQAQRLVPVSNATDNTRPVFIRAASRCDSKLSSIVLASLKEAIGASGKYRLVSTLDDEGKLDLVHTIYMTCVENNEVSSVATQYGIAKCKSSKECGSIIDGDSLNVSLCNANLSTDCGRALFKGFDYYMGLNRPLKLPF
jgi:TPR repeat protein